MKICNKDHSLILLFHIGLSLSLKFGNSFFMCHCQAINDNDIRNVVLSYLVHNCFNETVDSFITSTGMKQPADYLEGMEKRKSK